MPPGKSIGKGSIEHLIRCYPAHHVFSVVMIMVSTEGAGMHGRAKGLFKRVPGLHPLLQQMLVMPSSVVPILDSAVMEATWGADPMVIRFLMGASRDFGTFPSTSRRFQSLLQREGSGGGMKKDEYCPVRYSVGEWTCQDHSFGELENIMHWPSPAPFGTGGDEEQVEVVMMQNNLRQSSGILITLVYLQLKDSLLETLPPWSGMERWG